MKLLRNSLPIVCFATLLLFWIGWSWLDWATTTLLPWTIALFALFVCSLSWAMSTSPTVRRLNALLTIAAAIPGIILVFDLAGIRSLWAFFTLAGFGSVLLFLYDTARSSSIYKGGLKYVLLVPPALVLYAVIALFGWNGSLFPAWIGLLLMVLLAVIGLLGKRR